MNDVESTIRWYMSQGLSLEDSISEIKKVLRYIPDEVLDRARYNIQNITGVKNDSNN